MNFVSRSEWGARTPTGVTPASGLVGTAGHWNGPTVWHGSIGSHASCPIIVRGIQNYHMDAQGWTDVAYGALACPHGYVFEGRGPGVRTAANGTNTANGLASAVCYLGGESDPLTPDGLQAMFDAWLWLTGGDRTGHRDWCNSHCPGDDIYAAYLAGPQQEEDMPLTPEDIAAVADAVMQRLNVEGAGIGTLGFGATVQRIDTAAATILNEDRQHATDIYAKLDELLSRPPGQGVSAAEVIDALRDRLA